jgi:UPF0271 protein
MGESYGAWEMGADELIMPYVSSANIACGFHAGDSETIANTIQLAIKHGVAIGAHPSFPDLQGFGRREMTFTPEEIHNIVAYQIAAVKGMCKAFQARLYHVKPHGALYNMAAREKSYAEAIAGAVRSIDDSLILFGLSGSFLISEGQRAGLRTASEVFADRTYQSDGSLTPRTADNALITNTKDALAQVLAMVEKGTVESIDNKTVGLEAETVCIHGDGKNALEFAIAINNGLREADVEIRKPV